MVKITTRIKLGILLLTIGSILISGCIDSEKPSEIDGQIKNTLSSNEIIFNAAQVSSYDTVEEARDIVLLDKYAYVAAGKNGLVILDISNPAKPIFVSNYDTSGEAYGISISGKYAYIADSNNGLEIIDIINKNNPIAIGNYELNKLYSYDEFGLDVAVSGKYAYLVDGYNLRIIDISNPSLPTLKGYYNTAGGALSVLASENIVYILDGDMLSIIDVSNPESPTRKGYYNIKGNIYGVEVRNNYAYVSYINKPDESYKGSLKGLDVVDISNPEKPFQVGRYEGEGRRHYTTGRKTYGIAVSDDYAYVTNGNIATVTIINISNPSSPELAGYFETPGLAMNIAVKDDFAYVADYWKGVDIWHVEKTLENIIIESTKENNEITNNKPISLGKGELGYDDGEKDGAGSDSPRGQAVFFPINSKLKINGIKFYGSRYDGSLGQFEIEIWDSNFKKLYSDTYDYADYFPEFYTSKKELKYGWVDIKIPDIEVNDDFYVTLFTYSGPPSWKSRDYPGVPTGGIYIGLDNDTKSGNSYMVNKNPNRIITWPTSWNLRQESTDWMIRVICESDKNCVEVSENKIPKTEELDSVSDVKTPIVESHEPINVESTPQTGYQSSICRECHGVLHSIIYKPKFIYDDDNEKSGWYYSNQILSSTYAAPIKGILGFFVQFSNEHYVKVPDDCEVPDSL